MTIQELKKIVYDSLPTVVPDFYKRETYKNKLYKMKEWQWERIRERHVMKMKFGEYIDFKGLLEYVRRSRVK